MTEILGIIAVAFWVIGIYLWYRWKAKRIEKEFEDSKKTAMRKNRL